MKVTSVGFHERTQADEGILHHRHVCRLPDPIAGWLGTHLLVERLHEGLDRREASGGVEGRRPMQHVGQRPERVHEVDVGVGLLTVAKCAREQLAGDHREAVLVGPLRHRLTAELLRRGVRRCVRPSGVRGRPTMSDGDAEVGQVRVADLVEQHVGRLHVTMDDSGGMRRSERITDLVHEPGDALDRPSPIDFHQRLEVASTQKAEHQERAARLSPEVVQRHDVRMLEMGDQLRLRFESTHERRVVRQFRADDLHRHLAADARLHREIHRTERALTQQFAECIATGHPPRARTTLPDPRFEIDRRPRGFKTRLGSQSGSKRRHHPQRIGTAIAVVERPHQEPHETLSERELDDQRLEIGCGTFGSTHADQVLDALLVGNEAELFEPHRGGTGPVLDRELAECPSVPHGVGLLVERHRVGRRR